MQHFSSQRRLQRFRARLWPKTAPKPTKTHIFLPPSAFRHPDWRPYRLAASTQSDNSHGVWEGCPPRGSPADRVPRKYSMLRTSASGNNNNLLSLRISNKNYNCNFVFLAGFRPNLAPKPLESGRARKMVQKSPKISPGDQF